MLVLTYNKTVPMKLDNILPLVSLILCLSCIKEPLPIEEVKEELPVIDTVIRYDSENVYEGIGLIIDGKRNGEWTWTYYDDKGELKDVGNYVNDTLEGNYKRYYKGAVIHEGVYSKGEKVGEWKFYYRCKNIARAKKDGGWKYYCKGGRISKVENYINNTLNGVYKEYYYNGKVRLEGLYSNGKKDKKWVFYSKNGVKEKELFYAENSILWELQYLASSCLNDQNECKIIRPIYYSDKRPDLPYSPVVFNASLDGVLFIDGHKVIDLKKGQELELLMREDEYTYSYRHPWGRSYSFSMQSDSVGITKDCEEYLILEEDSLLVKVIQTGKLNELMTYLNNPIEANYNYKWNDNALSEFKRDYKIGPKLDSVFSLVSSKRKEILMNEFINYIDNPVDSNYRKEWRYNLKRTDNIVFDSLMFLAYYAGHEDFLKLDSPYNEYITFDTIVIDDVQCFPKINLDTIFFYESACLHEDPLFKQFQENYGEGYFYFDIRDPELKVKNHKIDIQYSSVGGCGEAWSMLLVIKQENGNKVIFKLSEATGYRGSIDSYYSTLTLDGKLSVRITKEGLEYNTISNDKGIHFDNEYDVILDYGLNDSLDFEFKGIRMIDEINHY